MEQEGRGPAERRADDQPGLREFIDFLRLVCRLLMECGSSSNRVELLTQRLGASWGFEVETLAIPTGVWITVRKGTHNLVELTRIRSWSVDLDRLARLNELVTLIHAHHISIATAYERLCDEKERRPPYSRTLTLVAGALASPVLVFHYGAPAAEALLALPLGIVVQLLNKYVFIDEQRYLGDFLSAAFIALYSYLFTWIFPGVDAPRLIVGGLVVLVPGLVLVNAVHELAQKNLVSGAAKLLEAVMITISLGCGVLFVVGALALVRT